MSTQEEFTDDALSNLINGSQETPETPVQPVVPPVDEAPTTSTEDVKTTEPVTPVTTEPNPNEAPQFNVADELSKLSGGKIKSPEDLTSILSQVEKNSELDARIKQYEAENADLKTKATTSPFANPLVAKMNELYAGGASSEQIDAFVKINKVESIDALQPLEKMSLALQIREGLTKEQAEAYVSGSYNLTPIDPENAADVAEANREAIRLQIDSKKEAEFLKTHKVEVSKVPTDDNSANEQRIQQQTEQHVAALKPIAKNIIDSISFKDVVINGKDGEAAIKIDLPISPESKQFMESKVMDVIAQSGLNIPNTEEGIKHITSIAENILVLQNYKNWIAESVNTRETQVRAEYVNPSVINRGPDTANDGKTDKDLIEDYLNQHIDKF